MKLVAAERGLGRLMFALVRVVLPSLWLLCLSVAVWQGLLKLSYRKGKEAVVLEVLGQKFNKPAVALYREFGFKPEVAYDWTCGPAFQVRDLDGHTIIMFMAKKADAHGAFVSLDLLRSTLDLSRLERKHAGSEAVVHDVTNTAVASRPPTARVLSLRRHNQPLRKFAPQAQFVPVVPSGGVTDEDDDDDDDATDSEEDDADFTPSPSRSAKSTPKRVQAATSSSPKTRASKGDGKSNGSPQRTATTTTRRALAAQLSAVLPVQEAPSPPPLVQQPLPPPFMDDPTVLALHDLLASGFILEEEYERRLIELRR